MREASSDRRPQSGKSGRALSVIADALQDHCDQTTVVALAEAVGHAKSTVHQWGANMHSWPAAPLLTLARNVPSLRVAVLAYLDGATPPEPEAAAAVTGAINVIERGAELMRVLADAIRDGRFSQFEDQTVTATANSLMEMLPALVRDVHAAAMRSR